MKQLNYDIWLSQTVGAVKSMPQILAYFGSPRGVYEATPREREESKCFSKQALRKMEETPLEGTYFVLEQCYRDNVDILCPEDPEYPALLKLIPDHPRILYARGNLPCWEERLPLALVGTRNACLSSQQAAADLAGTLSKAGALIVSGGALGIDTAAHIGALDAGAPTVAVLGSGFGSSYLRQNESLRQVIAQRGVLLSELPPGCPPSPGTFPRRNRIIAGLSAATVVIEAQIKSGSLITSKYAMEYGREVMALPGEKDALAFSGSNQLLRDGATAIRCAADVLVPLLPCYPDAFASERLRILESELLRDVLTQSSVDGLPHLNRALEQQAKVNENSLRSMGRVLHKKELQEEVSPIAKAVYGEFQGNPVNLDQLVQSTTYSVNQLLGALTELELLGYVALDENRNYNLKQ